MIANYGQAYGARPAWTRVRRSARLAALEVQLAELMRKLASAKLGLRRRNLQRKIANIRERIAALQVVIAAKETSGSSQSGTPTPRPWLRAKAMAAGIAPGIADQEIIAAEIEETTGTAVAPPSSGTGMFALLGGMGLLGAVVWFLARKKKKGK